LLARYTKLIVNCKRFVGERRTSDHPSRIALEPREQYLGYPDPRTANRSPRPCAARGRCGTGGVESGATPTTASGYGRSRAGVILTHPARAPTQRWLIGSG